MKLENVKITLDSEDIFILSDAIRDYYERNKQALEHEHIYNLTCKFQSLVEANE